jgi:hypothetical protein
MHDCQSFVSVIKGYLSGNVNEPHTSTIDLAASNDSEDLMPPHIDSK